MPAELGSDCAHRVGHLPAAPISAGGCTWRRHPRRPALTSTKPPSRHAAGG